jgi:hypothetical protein
MHSDRVTWHDATRNCCIPVDYLIAQGVMLELMRLEFLSVADACQQMFEKNMSVTLVSIAHIAI